MKDKLITYKTAELLKKRGFKPETPSTDYVPMYVDGELSEGQEDDHDRGNFCLAVTQTTAHTFIRKNLEVLIQVYNSASGYLWALSLNPGGTDLGWCDHSGNCEMSGAYITYEDALEHAIEMCLTKTFGEFSKTPYKHIGLYADFIRESIKNNTNK